MKDCSCIWCGKVFKSSRAQRNTREQDKAGPFCSKICTGKYGADVQNGGKILGRESIDVSYYHLNYSYCKTYVENPYNAV